MIANPNVVFLSQGRSNSNFSLQYRVTVKQKNNENTEENHGPGDKEENGNVYIRGNWSFKGTPVRRKEVWIWAVAYLFALNQSPRGGFVFNLALPYDYNKYESATVTIAYILFFICSSWEIAVGERSFSHCHFDSFFTVYFTIRW